MIRSTMSLVKTKATTSLVSRSLSTGSQPPSTFKPYSLSSPSSAPLRNLSRHFSTDPHISSYESSLTESHLERMKELDDKLKKINDEIEAMKAETDALKAAAAEEAEARKTKRVGPLPIHLKFAEETGILIIPKDPFDPNDPHIQAIHILRIINTFVPIFTRHLDAKKEALMDKQKADPITAEKEKISEEAMAGVIEESFKEAMKETEEIQKSNPWMSAAKEFGIEAFKAGCGLAWKYVLDNWGGR